MKIRKLSLKWRVTLMTMGMIAISCILMKTLLCSYGLSMMDELGQYALGFSTECGQAMHDGEAERFRAEFSAELAEIKTSFCHNSWYVVGIVSVLSGIIAYFVSWRSLSPLRDFAAQIDGIRMHSIDKVRIDEDSITEFRQLSRSFNKMLVRISRAYDAQRQFTGNAAHELRTPLALMQTQLDTYAEGDSSVSAEEAIAVLRDQTERLSKVVRTLLDMSELQSVPRTDRIDIGPMVEEVLTDLLPLAEKKKITLAQEGGNVRMTGSDILIYRVLYNLVENGIKYNKQGGNVTVSYRQEENMAVIHVTDTGQGIPEKCQSNIFQPFYRIDKSRSREYGGVGLGLSFAWESVRLHGGSISVLQSTPEGSTIEVELPV